MDSGLKGMNSIITQRPACERRGELKAGWDPVWELEAEGRRAGLSAREAGSEKPGQGAQSSTSRPAGSISPADPVDQKYCENIFDPPVMFSDVLSLCCPSAF